MRTLELAPVRQAAGTVRLPGSKSISNRALLLAALAQGDTRLVGLLEADDTRVMREALARLGVHCTPEGDALRVQGAGGAPRVREAELFLGNAGTAFRPLTAVLALAGGHYRLSGVARMHERPIGDLVDALRQAGARIDYLAAEGYPPLEIHPAALRSGVPLRVRGSVSSQFLSALLMALPVTAAPGEIEVVGELISKPYVEITLRLMARFGIDVQREDWRRFRVPAGPYRAPGTLRVEGDASSASYFLAAGAIGGGPVRVEGVGRDSIQGDRGARARAARAVRPRPQPHSRRGDDRGGGRAVRARPVHDPQRRELARQGDRPHRGDGDRAAQARRRSRRARRRPAHYAAARAASGQRRHLR